MESQTNEKRKAGVLMPIFSLPSKYGIGTLGAGAYNFVAWLKRSKVKVWQILPLQPTGFGDSPYQSCASDALNYYFIDLEMLVQDEYLEKRECDKVDFGGNLRRVDYEKLFLNRISLLKKAFSRFKESEEPQDWIEFKKTGKYSDFALFMMLKEKFSYRPWTEWDAPYNKYDEDIVSAFIRKNEEEYEFWQWTQYIFLKQWRALKKYANMNGVEIIGDMPIYVSGDSVEMWKYGKELFLTDEEGNQTLQAGVPPDAFSADGQLWGNPVYNWEKMAENGYRWWHNRIDDALSLFDMVRIDHFRGFEAFYAVPMGETTARNGEWRKGPSSKLFEGLEGKRIIAEDLGMIDDNVRNLLKTTGYPGMRVYEFSFGGNPDNEHKPVNYPENVVAYTGTHDNLPFAAFAENWKDEERVKRYKEMHLDCRAINTAFCGSDDENFTKSAIRLVMRSAAKIVIVPMHDVLCLGAEARINTPSTVSLKNWSYRFSAKDFKATTWIWMKSLVERSGR